MNAIIGSLCSGAGMLDEAVASVLDGTVAWHCEIDPGACAVLEHRYPGVPNHGDLTAADWSGVEPVDVLCGGTPCQDVSHAGKRAGMRAGTRSGLWASMVDAIDALRPQLVVWENVRGVLSAEADSAMESCAGCVGDADDGAVLRALGRVLGDLAELGYDARWHGLRAADVGAPHGRFRVFVLAWPADDAEGQRRGPSGHRDDQAGTADAPVRATDLTTADAQSVGPGARRVTPGRESRAHGQSRGRRDGVPTDADGDGRESLGRLDTLRCDPDRRSGADVAWGVYEPAIRRWEQVLGRPAPQPTTLGAKGGPQLSARFDEWLMGWPDGWVTDPAIWRGWKPSAARNAQIKLCGNGVVPQQVEHALRLLLAHLAERAA